MKLDKEDIHQIRRLVFHREYNRIYHLYGSKIYKNYVPKIIQIQDIFRLLKKKNYDLLSKKHEIDFYYSQYFLDVYMESGKHVKGYISQYKNIISEFFPPLCTTAFAITLVLKLGSILVFGFNSLRYEEEIEAYNEYLKEYQGEMKGESNPFEIIENTVLESNCRYEYGKPEIDAFSYLRLDVLNGVACCRNIADDFVIKMNTIHPEYEAQVCVVYSPNENANFLRKLYGNHNIVFMNYNDLILCVDPGNGEIGYLQNGKIQSFAEEGMELDFKYITTLFSSLFDAQISYSNFWHYVKKYYDSFSIEEKEVEQFFSENTQTLVRKKDKS